MSFRKLIYPLFLCLVFSLFNCSSQFSFDKKENKLLSISPKNVLTANGLEGIKFILEKFKSSNTSRLYYYLMFNLLIKKAALGVLETKKCNIDMNGYFNFLLMLIQTLFEFKNYLHKVNQAYCAYNNGFIDQITFLEVANQKDNLYKLKKLNSMLCDIDYKVYKKLVEYKNYFTLAIENKIQVTLSMLICAYVVFKNKKEFQDVINNINKAIGVKYDEIVFLNLLIIDCILRIHKNLKVKLSRILLLNVMSILYSEAKDNNIKTLIANLKSTVAKNKGNYYTIDKDFLSVIFKKAVRSALIVKK